MPRLLPLILGALLTLAALPARAAAVDTGHLTAELVAGSATVAPGGTVWVALTQRIDKGWHTYWRNPGDSGEATKAVWTLPAGWSAGDFVWPTPERQPTGPLMNYGYQDEVLLPVQVSAPANAKPGEIVTLKAAAAFLVCEEICVPEDAVLELPIKVGAGPALADPRWGARIATAVAAAPKPAGLAAAFQKTGDKLVLAVAGAPLKGRTITEAYFFPFSATVLDHAKPQAVELGPEGLTISTTAGVGFQAPQPPTEVAGVLALNGRAYEVSAAAGPAPAGVAGLGPLKGPAGGEGGGVGLGLIAAVGFALLGGLILNLMPCVFPVLAMKAASLAGQGESPSEARRHGVAFLLGVVATFLGLAALLLAVKAAGAEVGWGFQLQTPGVVAVLTLTMLLVALNLSGVFEVGTSVQNLGAGAASKGGSIGAFFTGALAVVVAAPCTAPFMAPALGWALTQPPAAALAVFLALGLGFAAPFTALSIVPALRRLLPKPGPWMDGFKKLMAFPMYGAAAWLAWVLTIQAGPDGLARLFAAAVVAALAAWLFGSAQTRQAAGARAPLGVSLALVLAVAALVGSAWPPYPAAAATEPASGALAYEPYSAERLAALRAEGKPVFVNFTAAWCVTCKVNERVALSSPKVAAAFQRTGVAYLKGDWTNKDAAIAEELARHGRAGVPLYLLYGSGGGEGVILPQVLSEGAVVKALETAARAG